MNKGNLFMNLENFLKNSVLPEMQVTSLYFKPNIPQDKLVNAIKEYAPNIGMSTVIALIDETFWGSGKEGMIITDENIILSKKLGGRSIPLSSVNQIHIKDKNLIINDIPVTKFNNPEVLPLTAFGSKLNEFITATKNTTNKLKKNALDVSTTSQLSIFLTRLTEPLYFESTPIDRRKPGATTIGYVLAANINEEQLKFIRFKGNFASNEELLCLSWLDSHDNKDSFFCVTNCGVHSVLSGQPATFLSHDNLRSLSALEEYKESRYVGIRLSNNDGIIVSIQNTFIRPYAFELFSGLISILNGHEPTSRIINENLSQKETNIISSQHDSFSSVDNRENISKFTNSIEQQNFDRHRNSSIPLRHHSNDHLFDFIIQINSVDNVGDFIGSLLSDSNNPNSKIKKKFQSYIARTTTFFRKEIVEKDGFFQFKNDIATMEVSGAVMAFVFIQMLERGLSEDIAKNILFEGIRATFNIKSSAQRDPTSAALIKIIDSYLSDDSTNEIFLNIILRLIGSNLNGSLLPNYNEVLEKHFNFLDEFIPTIDPGFTNFVNKMINESNFLIDDILDTRW